MRPKPRVYKKPASVPSTKPVTPKSAKMQQTKRRKSRAATVVKREESIEAVQAHEGEKVDRDCDEEADWVSDSDDALNLPSSGYILPSGRTINGARLVKLDEDGRLPPVRPWPPLYDLRKEMDSLIKPKTDVLSDGQTTAIKRVAPSLGTDTASPPHKRRAVMPTPQSRINSGPKAAVKSNKGPTAWLNPRLTSGTAQQPTAKSVPVPYAGTKVLCDPFFLDRFPQGAVHQDGLPQMDYASNYDLQVYANLVPSEAHVHSQLVHDGPLGAIPHPFQYKSVTDDLYAPKIPTRGYLQGYGELFDQNRIFGNGQINSSPLRGVPGEPAESYTHGAITTVQSVVASAGLSYQYDPPPFGMIFEYNPVPSQRGGMQTYGKVVPESQGQDVFDQVVENYAAICAEENEKGFDFTAY